MSTSILYHTFNVGSIDYRAARFSGNRIFIKAEGRKINPEGTEDNRQKL